MIKYSKKGLSLIDVIFAIGIILVGLITILSLLRYVIIAGRISNDKFIATNLAEEGIEIVRAIRDSNWKQNMTNDSDPTTTIFPINVPTNYNVDYNNTTLLPYVDTVLKIDGSWFYSYDASGTPTKYKRRIYLDPTKNGTNKCTDDAFANYDNTQCIAVVSEVKWENYTLVVEDRLYNWRP